MTIILTGGTGLVGQALGQKLADKNYRIHLLVRKSGQNISYPCKTFLWPDVQSNIPEEVFPKDENYGIIHLAGEPLFQWPWTKRTKDKIHSSRVEGARKLVTTFKRILHPPQFFISASAIGIYGEQGDKQVTETSPIADQNLFLQKVCRDWEREALKAVSICQTLIFRLGIVLSYEKGFLYEQVKWLKRGFLPRLITQKPNWLSWISLEDLISMLLWAIENQRGGIYNAVSPNPVLLRGFYTSLIKRTEHKFVSLPLPLALAKVLGGEMMKNLLASCPVYPERALTQGFVFKEEELEEALKQS